MVVLKLILPKFGSRRNPFFHRSRRNRLLGLKVLKSNFIDVHRNITSLENDSTMKSLIPVILENITCLRGEDLKSMAIHRRDAKRIGWRND
jgi:hypothetical protein